MPRLGWAGDDQDRGVPMPRRTMTIQELRVHPKRKSDEPWLLTNLFEAGIDLLDHYCNWAQNLPPDHFKDPVRKQYGTKPAVVRKNRLILTTMATGPYDQAGRHVYDVDQHVSRFRTDREHSATIPTRMALVCPPGASMALIFEEREGHYACSRRIISSWAAQLQATAETHDMFATVHRRTRTEPGAWLAAAELEKVLVVRRSHNAAPGSDGSTTHDVDFEADFSRVFEPPQGRWAFPRRVKDLLFGDTAEALESFGVEDADEIDNILVTVGDQTNRKTMELGVERTPALRLVLNEETQPTLSDEAWAEKVAEEAAGIYRGLGRTWDPQWVS